MTATDQNIPSPGSEFIAGDTAILQVTVTDDDGNVYDVSNYDISFALADYSGDDTIVTKTQADTGTEIVDGPNGRVDVRLEAADTEGLGSAQGTEYYYEVELTSDDSNPLVSTVTTGTLTMKADTA